MTMNGLGQFLVIHLNPGKTWWLSKGYCRKYTQRSTVLSFSPPALFRLINVLVTIVLVRFLVPLSKVYIIETRYELKPGSQRALPKLSWKRVSPSKRGMVDSQWPKRCVAISWVSFNPCSLHQYLSRGQFLDISVNITHAGNVQLFLLSIQPKPRSFRLEIEQVNYFNITSVKNQA